VLIAAIILSVTVVMLDSVATIHQAYEQALYGVEWFFTMLFTIEYLVRLYASKSRVRYIFSFYGIIDLLAIMPTWFSIFVPGTQYLLVIRFFRVLRIFRLLKLVKFVKEAEFVKASIIASGRKIVFFLFFVLVTVSIIGSLMYLIEGEENRFTSIPKGVYWAIVTITTVGYGDIYPQTVLGRTLAALLMITGTASAPCRRASSAPKWPPCTKSLRPDATTANRAASATPATPKPASAKSADGCRSEADAPGQKRVTFFIPESSGR
jgi:voltage-gated potassium channel